jgi:hypothetical protein
MRDLKSADARQPDTAAEPGHAPASTARSNESRLPSSDRFGIGAIAALMLVIAGIGAFTGPSFWAGVESDQATEQQVRERARKFADMGALTLRLVAPGERDGALAAMNLPEGDKARLAELVGAHSSPTANAQAKGALRLAWLTLWDTDAQDGDQVRIDSSGFSTVVTLANAPLTFAVPVPDGGVVNITGVRDGGGGITVGAMSGVSRVALPIMSVGQVLGVPVTVR